MKKILMISLLFVFAVAAQAQKDVTKFLGIPVDGTKTAMINKLKAKGFTPIKGAPEGLQGEFNGMNVHIFVVTNNNKVYRIMVADENTVSETDIRIRFNNLCLQFEKNKNYVNLYEDQTIPNDEDISYGMSVKNKRYEAIFYQKSELDSATITQQLLSDLIERYGKDWENLTEELQEEIRQYMYDWTIDFICKKKVWFMISEYMGKYYISMYYDNVYNKSDGEDL